jgi:hypothetical protein
MNLLFPQGVLNQERQPMLLKQESTRSISLSPHVPQSHDMAVQRPSPYKIKIRTKNPRWLDFAIGQSDSTLVISDATPGSSDVVSPHSKTLSQYSYKR